VFVTSSAARTCACYRHHVDQAFNTSHRIFMRRDLVRVTPGCKRSAHPGSGVKREPPLFHLKQGHVRRGRRAWGAPADHAIAPLPAERLLARATVIVCGPAVRVTRISQSRTGSPDSRREYACESPPQAPRRREGRTAGRRPAAAACFALHGEASRCPTPCAPAPP
jgi:hypothetical protein